MKMKLNMHQHDFSNRGITMAELNGLYSQTLLQLLQNGFVVDVTRMDGVVSTQKLATIDFLRPTGDNLYRYRLELQFSGDELSVQHRRARLFFGRLPIPPHPLAKPYNPRASWIKSDDFELVETLDLIELRYEAYFVTPEFFEKIQHKRSVRKWKRDKREASA